MGAAVRMMQEELDEEEEVRLQKQKRNEMVKKNKVSRTWITAQLEGNVKRWSDSANQRRCPSRRTSTRNGS